MTPWENHTLTKVFLSMVVYRKQTECVKCHLSCLQFDLNIRRRKQTNTGHTQQTDWPSCVSLELVTTHRIRQQLNWQGTSACLGFRFPLLPASPRHAPSVFPLTGSHGPACKFGCFLCTLFAEALIHDFQRKWNLPVSIRWHGLTLYLLKPNLQLSSLFVLLGRDDNGEFVCSR